jgi:hypothetical protein
MSIPFGIDLFRYRSRVGGGRIAHAARHPPVYSNALPSAPKLQMYIFNLL